jgi:hypothetical protein
MKKIIPLLAVLLFTSMLAAQDLIINDTVYNAGFYTSFEEFKYNKPSIPFNYETKSVTYNARGGEVTYHRINLRRRLQNRWELFLVFAMVSMYIFLMSRAR